MRSEARCVAAPLLWDLLHHAGEVVLQPLPVARPLCGFVQCVLDQAEGFARAKTVAESQFVNGIQLLRSGDATDGVGAGIFKQRVVQFAA